MSREKKGIGIMDRVRAIMSERRMGVPALAIAVMLLGAGARWGFVNADVVSAWRDAGDRRAPDRAVPKPLALAPAPSERRVSADNGTPVAEHEGTGFTFADPAHATPALMPVLVPGSLIALPESDRFSVVRRRPVPIDGRGPALPMPEDDRDAEDQEEPRGTDLRTGLWSLSERAVLDADRMWRRAAF